MTSRDETHLLGDEEKQGSNTRFDPELEEFGGKYRSKFAIGQVTIRCPETNPLSWIAIVYGFLPFIIPGGFFILWMVYHRFMGKFGFLLAIICSIINELIFKNLAKQPRPENTANRKPDGTPTHGMPSGHVLNAFTLMIWSICEVALSKDAESRQIQVWWLCVIIAVMLPVPWARWWNEDHSAQQCAVSIFLGFIAGICAFVIRTTYFSNHWQPWDRNAAPFDALINVPPASGTIPRAQHI